jgi:hypothetical protein
MANEPNGRKRHSDLGLPCLLKLLRITMELVSLQVQGEDRRSITVERAVEAEVLVWTRVLHTAHDTGPCIEDGPRL